MTEKIILKETVNQGKPVVENKPKKRNYKPRKKKEITENVFSEEDKDLHHVVNSEKPYVHGVKMYKSVGKYSIGGPKKFNIYFDEKPNWLHRKCMKLFLGWTWEDNK